MAPKAAKGKAKEEKVAQPAAGSDFPAVPHELLVRYPQRWVQLHFKLLTSSLLDDVVRLPQTATLHAVEAHLVAHHGGGIAKLVFWKDSIEPKTIQRDFSLSLKQVWSLNDATPHTITNPNPSSVGGGVRRYGAYGEPEDHHVVLCYDYKAHDSDSHLIMRSPRYTVEGFTGGTKTRGFIGLADDQTDAGRAADGRSSAAQSPAAASL